MRKRRKPRVVWLPNDPFFSVDAAGLAHSTLMSAQDTVSGALGDTNTIVAPVVRDTTINPLTPGSTLADINSSGYRLRRIVGKFWCYFTNTNNQDTPGFPEEVIVTAGFIILRVDDAGLPLNQANIASYSTQIIENNEAPWIWRRSWLLKDGPANVEVNAGVPFLVQPVGPGGVGALGGNADGPHIDQKTARIVGQDERLMLVVTSTNMRSGDQQLARGISYNWEVRVLASMRTTSGNRRNASR